MKKLLSLMLTLVTILSLSTLFLSCKDKYDGKIEATVSQEESINGEINPVVIVVNAGQQSLKGATLIDCMNQLQDDEFSFSVESGMVTKINGTKNGTNSFWMLYTNDAENANTAWGTYEHNEVVYSSAILGAETLQIKAGYTYIWVYQTF